MGVRPRYKQTEVGVIPEDWDCELVGNAVAHIPNAIVGGPFGSNLVSTDYVDEGVPVIRGQNMGGSQVGGEFAFVSPAKARKLNPNMARPGDIVLTQRGTLGQVAIVPSGDFQLFLVSQSQMKLTLNENRHDKNFFLQYFGSHFGQKQIIDSAIQTGVPHTNLGILRRYRFPSPLLPEQRAIAEVLSDVDAALAGLTRLIAKKRDLKHAAMQTLLTGQTRLPGFSGKWEVKRLGDHVTFLKNGVNSRAQLTLSDPVRYLHYGDIHVTPLARLNPRLNDMPRLPHNLATRLSHLEGGDLVFVDASEDIDGVGKSVEIEDADELQIVSGLHTIAARFDKTVLADGFKRYLQFSPAFKAHLRRLAAGTKVYATNRSHIASVEMELPTVEEQCAITAVLSDIDAEIEALEAQFGKTRALKQAMMQALLTGQVRLPVAKETEKEPAHA